ncbi:ACT domain-containing protein [Porticoccaceae bacterium LTM1]|nr:ACT domain-containing protein [Porticoccaceae bacterium LTM1]
MSRQYVLTITAKDQTGLVEKIADAVVDAGGNWLESSLCHLAGKFAGVALVSVPPEQEEKLMQSLKALADKGIEVGATAYETPASEPTEELLMVKIVANDRPGIVQELTRLLASLNVNVETFDSGCESAAMYSQPVFEASVVVQLPANLTQESLANHLETLSDDLMVEIHDLLEDEEAEA